MRKNDRQPMGAVIAIVGLAMALVIGMMAATSCSGPGSGENLPNGITNNGTAVGNPVDETEGDVFKYVRYGFEFSFFSSDGKWSLAFEGDANAVIAPPSGAALDQATIRFETPPFSTLLAEGMGVADLAQRLKIYADANVAPGFEIVAGDFAAVKLVASETTTWLLLNGKKLARLDYPTAATVQPRCMIECLVFARPGVSFRGSVTDDDGTSADDIHKQFDSTGWGRARQ